MLIDLQIKGEMGVCRRSQRDLESEKIPGVIGGSLESNFFSDFDGADVVFAGVPADLGEAVL